MPTGHTLYRTQIRVADLGASGFIHPHRVLELMQEAAACASTQAGYKPARYHEMGASWYIREVCLAVDGEVAYGEDVEVETWISAIRRFRSTREYVLSCRGAVVARGHAEWLFLERDERGRVRPRQPDDEMLEAFPMGQGAALARDEVPPYVEPDADLSAAEPDRRVVRATEIDQHGHVNHVRYLAWLDDHGQRVWPGQRIVLVRLRYLLDAHMHDPLVLYGHAAPEGHVQIVSRGEERLVRAIVRRVPIAAE